MKNKCLQAIEEYKMFAAGDTVVVGVSGGADSMALLHFLHSHMYELDIRVIAAHFHHGIRAEEADRDLAFVREFCSANDITFVTAKENIPEKSRQLHMSVEECARSCRYSFLQSVCENAKIATAHTNSDSCESFLFNLTRGTGLQGLCGIPATRDNIVRPLIFCSSQDTRNYCAEHGIAWCEDSTNQCDDYSRNFIRLHTVPGLKKINERFEENALRCMQILQNENDFLKQAAQQAYEHCLLNEQSLSIAGLMQYHDAVIMRVLLLFARDNGCRDVSMIQINRLLNASDGESLTLNGAVRFQKKDGILSVLLKEEQTQPLAIRIETETECVSFFDSLVFFKHKVYNNEKSGNYCAIIDADKISVPVLRTRADGDKIRLKERKCTKTVKQLFTEKKISVSARARWPVLADENGVIWIGGFGVDESRLADRNTKNILMVEWRKTL